MRSDDEDKGFRIMQLDYCALPDEGEPGWDQPCPACGATIEGNDPVRGICQSRFNRGPPRPILFLQLVDKQTGEVVASQPVL
jgi:hypothetical protein